MYKMPKGFETSMQEDGRMKEYRTVRELNENEIEELRERYFWEEKHNKIYVYSITDNMLYKKYGDINFVKDDFACNQ